MFPLLAGGRADCAAKPRLGAEEIRDLGGGAAGRQEDLKEHSECRASGLLSLGPRVSESHGRRRGSEGGVKTQGGLERWIASLEEGGERAASG